MPHRTALAFALLVAASGAHAAPFYSAERVVDADLFEVLAVLHDVNRSCAWTPDCRASWRIRDLNDHSSLIYLRTTTPWPLEDRDVVIQTQVSIAPDGSWARAAFANVDLKDGPRPNDVVRMPFMTGAYRLERIGPDRTRVQYGYTADAGGNIPDKLAAQVLEDVPQKLLAGLARQVARTRGKYEAFRDRNDLARRARLAETDSR